MKYQHVAHAIFDQPWAITEAAFGAVLEVIELRLDGGHLSADEIAARLAVAEQSAGPRGGAQRAGSVAVIPVYGVLSHRANMLSEMSGGTSVQRLQASFRQALSDPDVGAIVLDVDSPGGAVSGIPELADEIRAARGQKPIIAVANTLMASAAYYIAAQADEIVASPSAFVGSIGVFTAHKDISKAEESLGLKTTLISAGKYKVEGNPYEPLPDEARAYAQSMIDETYGAFVNAVAKGRGTTASAVRDGYGEGRAVTAKEAVRLGMADRIGTLEDAIDRAVNPRARIGQRAEAEMLTEPVAEVEPTVERVGLSDASLLALAEAS
jgi:signal peptide peptidase SppA